MRKSKSGPAKGKPKSAPPPRNTKAKIGAGALKAFIRQGAKELAQILPAFPDSVRVVEEPGTIGNLTPGEVDRQKAVMKAAPKREIELDR
jgi:hypothetical protein